VYFRPHVLTPIATTDGRLLDFAPYVAAVDDEGRVAFQATLADGHTGVFAGDGGRVADIAVSTSATCPARVFASHPDLDGSGRLSVYATLKDGAEAVLRLHPDGRIETLGAPDGLPGIGPLGPTMNERGEVALRATSPAGRACVGVWRGEHFRALAEAGDTFHGFEGLPVVNDAGEVALRADLADGRQGVFLHRDGRLETVATTGDAFAEIGRFPALDGRGGVTFVARRGAGGWGIFASNPDGLGCLLDAGTGFESLRGVLVNDAGIAAFYGTPVGGRLGIYTGPDAARHRLLGLGDVLVDATVVDFALNPVSVNARGQLALRVALDDGRQFILRADPRD